MPFDTSITLLVDPRFPGGTSSAVAREIEALVGIVNLRIVALETRMFKGRKVNPRLAKALDEHGLVLEWDIKLVRDEIVVFHNPSCLKFNENLPLRIICDQLFVVAHENFLQPSGSEGFDVNLCLRLIEEESLSRAKFLAPVSEYTKENVGRWLKQQKQRQNWRITPKNWINICDFELCPPSADPKDRRGRMSRPGIEKFPNLNVMSKHFPEHAEDCSILGGDNLLLDIESIPGHWNVLPFGAMEVEEFLKGIDFFVYFTHENLRESFGRVIAEAVAAGKVVITERGLAKSFDGLVVASDGNDVDEIIQEFLAKPKKYQQYVRTAQKGLSRFDAATFRDNTFENIQHGKECTHDLL